MTPRSPDSDRTAPHPAARDRPPGPGDTPSMRPRPHVPGPQRGPRGGKPLTLADRIEPEGAGRRGGPPNLIAERLWTLLPATSTLHTNDDIISAGTIGRANGTSTTSKLLYNFSTAASG